MHMQHNSSAGLETVEDLEKPILKTGNKALNLENIIKLADEHKYQEAISELDKILADENDLNSESISAAHWHRAILYLTQDSEKNKEIQLPEALSDLYAVAKQVKSQEEAAPNDNYNLQGARFGSPVFVKPSQVSRKVIDWMRTLK
jgi:hypothetical protein